MNIIRKEFTYPSATGLADIFVRAWLPDDGNIKAVFQMVHGMAEHGERYEDFAAELCKAGYAFVINDHIGHGKSLKSNSERGYFGAEKNKNGDAFVEDVHTLTLKLKDEYKKPVILMGHSMGSFVARRYIAKYSSDILGAIICGTSGSNPGAAAGIMLAKIISKVKGEKHPSKLIDKIAFGSYNKRFEGRTPFDWLSKNTENVDVYIRDDGCGYLFTASGYQNMFELLSSVSVDAWYQAVPKKLPIFIVSGADDPVGNYSKGVQEVYDKLKETGHSDLKLKFYEGDRHEILNEADNGKIYGDIIQWCDALAK
ncbi:MAG: lysophospholipase [Ruminococcus sp.]|nr:lysophospholipase [Candidatus Copronaster equi]